MIFGKFKKWLGIEGVKLELLVPESIKATDGFVDGRIILTSLHDQTVSHIHLSLIERFTRGRKDNQLVDEYILGEITLEQDIEVEKGKEVYVDFELPFQTLSSNMDQYANKNILTKGIAKVAGSIHKAKSTYRVEATATVKGTALHPFDKKSLNM